MDNMLTVALVVLISSIVVFFSKEFGDLFKKLFAIPGMKLFLPLIFATGLVAYYESWVYLGLTKFQDVLLGLVEKLASWMPFRKGASDAVKILALMVFSFLPVMAIDFWIKKKKSYDSFRYAGLTITIVWLFLAVLLTINYRY
ncbi:hypothetical protein [Legionella micdadei]|uniref:Uncharacterized protein n=1 Tax=Legionella micdadei TaxID=451 RepID=A0A098GIR7_LEGMI|nr:hypothetical protein [Legionella micdadei]ARG96728.1 hypothetical protein B6N58_03020 [Legionella micdadei]ARG99475.1 hypothetical protein B6V88_03010 [Legionella micdadei]KTD26393.1 hypothetical protein Lmic_2487 [Legionella micdadei]NSL19031.1 hypothetical protein [Legionella micdadei]CEG61892.1 conserved membrane protein of unknown function [Legionella micdadei]